MTRWARRRPFVQSARRYAALAFVISLAACGGETKPTAIATPEPSGGDRATGPVVPCTGALGAVRATDPPGDVGPAGARRSTAAHIDLRRATIATAPDALCAEWTTAAPLRAGTILSIVLTDRHSAPIELNVQIRPGRRARVVCSGFGRDGDVTRTVDGEVGLQGRRAAMRVPRAALPPVAPDLRRFTWAAATQRRQEADAMPTNAAPTLAFP